MRRLPEFRFTLGQAMIVVGVIGVYLGFFASFKHYPEFILLILGLGAGYWVILVLPFAILEEVARRRAARSNRRPSDHA